MENTAINIKSILSNDLYVIPRYQRNYAWGKAEISQLIKDIDEFFEGTEHKSYYLGSLVCFKRENINGKEVFELLDGQQRHTTLTLINLALKNWESKNNETVPEETVPESNLKFESRKKSQNYIESLYKVKNELNKQIDNLNTFGTGNFKDAIEIIQEELRNKDISNFAKNFYENVFLFRVEVPEDTDLNHYFEIMNNRGEQLEKHEIVKAFLMGTPDVSDKNTFATIWDACSDMSDYVLEEVKNADNSDEDKTLIEILDNHSIPIDFPKEEKFVKDKYKSIIDFPNFLLQVLKLQYPDTVLDDKKLLEQFQKHLSEENFALKFIDDLHKYRLLFDKYVIKQDLSDAEEKKQNWGIRKLNDTCDGTIKTYKENENDEELIKLQTMLYCANSTNTYNNWLQEVLTGEKFSESIEAYTAQVYEIAKSRFDDANLSYPNISIFNLYFIDFLLWKLYFEKVQGKENIQFTEESLKNLEQKISQQKSLFNSFKFKQITSREHLAAQSNPSSKDIPLNDLNGIGNLCLISTSQNSAGNKESPIDKKKRFANDNESLKRIMMFESFDENDKWDTVQIRKHAKEIEALLKHYKEK